MNLIDDLIDFETPSESAICIHESGHAVSALICDARLEFVELLSDPKEHGLARNRIETLNQDQRRFVASAGFAVEFRLFREGRLVDASGRQLGEKAFIQIALGNNAAFDKRQFFERDMEKNGFWPKEFDQEFMDYSIRVSWRMPMDAVLTVANELMARRRLDSQEVRAIVDSIQDARL